MTWIRWEPGDDPSYFLSFTPRRIEDRERPVDPALIDRVALALARRPGTLGVLVTTEDDGHLGIHAAFDIPNGRSHQAARAVRRILRSLGLHGSTFGSGPACWGPSGYTIILTPRPFGGSRAGAGR